MAKSNGPFEGDSGRRATIYQCNPTDQDNCIRIPRMMFDRDENGELVSRKCIRLQVGGMAAYAVVVICTIPRLR
jgi:hypothetical protein